MSKLLNTSPTSIPSLTALFRWTPNHRMIHRLTVACIWAYTTNGANCWWGSCVVDHVFTPSTNGKSKRKIKNCNHIVSEWRYGKLFCRVCVECWKKFSRNAPNRILFGFNHNFSKNYTIGKIFYSECIVRFRNSLMHIWVNFLCAEIVFTVTDCIKSFILQHHQEW